MLLLTANYTQVTQDRSIKEMNEELTAIVQFAYHISLAQCVLSTEINSNLVGSYFFISQKHLLQSILL